MAEHIDGPLYYETMGESGPVMAFVHPNPMDQSCWIFQMAQMSTWYRCIAIDLPGYGKSPKARAGLTMQDIAQACWGRSQGCRAAIMQRRPLTPTFHAAQA
jgi:pimeloyl-ACP methyl ester carboxylesterase